MLRKVVLSLGLAAVAATTVMAADPLGNEDVAAAPVMVAPAAVEQVSLKDRMYGAVDYVGLADTSKAFYDTAKGTGRLVKGGAHVGAALLDAAAAAVKAGVVAPISAVYGGEASKHLDSAKANAVSAYGHLKAMAGDMPANYEDFKNAGVGFYQGGKKMATAAYEGVQKVAASEYVQNAKAKVSGWFSDAWDGAKSWAAKKVDQFAGVLVGGF